VGFEPTIPVFEKAKTFHAVDRATTVIGQKRDYAPPKIIEEYCKRREILIEAAMLNRSTQEYT
jgi:hypothetical protein